MAANERQGIRRPHGDNPDEYEAYKQNQEAEYQKWVATQDIYAGLALAYREGDPVPVSNVEAQGYDKNGLVRLANQPEEKPAKKGEVK